MTGQTLCGRVGRGRVSPPSLLLGSGQQIPKTHAQYTCAQKLCEPREDGGCRQGETIFSRTSVISFKRKKSEKKQEM